MTSTHEIAPGQVIDLSTRVVGVDGEARLAALVDQEPGQPPCRVDGLTIGAPLITNDSPHDGKVHPDSRDRR